MATIQDLPYLIKLLDDDQPEVRDQVSRSIRCFGGDLSSHIASFGIDLCPADRKLLTKILHPTRRQTLREEWLVPSNSLSAPYDDWDTFESLLRLISDYLHDGISLRPSLSDELDLLADECEEQYGQPTADDLRKLLFGNGRLSGNKDNYYMPENCDLCWTIESGLGNPIGLAVIYLLVGRRLNIEITACNFPSHFLARTVIDGKEFLVDCYHGGRLVELSQLLTDGTLTREALAAIRYSASPAVVLKRILVNLAHSWSRQGNEEDEILALELASSLEPLGKDK